MRTNIPGMGSGVGNLELIFYIFPTNSYILMYSLAQKVGTTRVFINTLALSGNEEFWEMLANEAPMAKN